MRIAVIGTGAMDSAYGGHLSQHNEVYLVGTAAPVVEHIQKKGLKLQKNRENILFSPMAVTSTEGIGTVDLMILFVKALFPRAAPSDNGNLIGPDTYVMTLQNDSDYEDILGEFADQDHIIIGTTEGNGAALSLDHIRRGGASNTNVGMLTEDRNGFLPKLKGAFDCCGFNVEIHGNTQQPIWDELFTNVSLSAVTGILQVDMSYIATDEYAWAMTTSLIREAAAMARATGLTADEEQIMAKIRETSEMSPSGYTSIRAGLRDGRRTKMDTISDSVVHVVAKVGVPVPSHEFMVNMVHTLEDKNWNYREYF